MTQRHLDNWYARPVLFVTDLGRSLEFYLERLGFVKKWHEADGKGTVCQVDHGDCEIILSQEGKPNHKARLFIELNEDQLVVLRRRIEERAIASSMSWWGYDVIQIDDPDGNELLFPVEE
jgi:catechol 2,3-dioxygenase-like lactoylglutathione lyase family enzyme